MKAREQSVSLGCRWTVRFRSDNSAGCSEGLAVISPWFKSVFHWILQVEIEWALQIERTERSPVNSTIRLLSPAPAAHCLWWGQFHLPTVSSPPGRAGWDFGKEWLPGFPSGPVNRRSAATWGLAQISREWRAREVLWRAPGCTGSEFTRGHKG